MISQYNNMLILGFSVFEPESPGEAELSLFELRQESPFGILSSASISRRTNNIEKIFILR